MSHVILDMAISVDGRIVGTSGGDDGLHDWYFAEGAAEEIKQELLESIGAIVLGRMAFGDSPDGFDTPYQVPHFVLTHQPRETIRRGGASFAFTNEGIAATLERAKDAAGTRDVCIAGGALTARQFLAAGLIDQIQLHIAPVILGGGVALFDAAGPPCRLERLRLVESMHANHVRYRVIKSSVGGASVGQHPQSCIGS